MNDSGFKMSEKILLYDIELSLKYSSERTKSSYRSIKYVQFYNHLTQEKLDNCYNPLDSLINMPKSLTNDFLKS